MRLHGTQRKRCHHSSAVHLSPRPRQAGFPGDQERGDSCSVPIRHQATGTRSRRWAGTGAKQNRGTTPKCSKTRDVEASPLCRDPLGPDLSLLLLSQCREPFTARPPQAQPKLGAALSPGLPRFRERRVRRKPGPAPARIRRLPAVCWPHWVRNKGLSPCPTAQFPASRKICLNIDSEGSAFQA